MTGGITTVANQGVQWTPMIALLAPGQGAQAPGMLAPWLEMDGAEDRIAAWSCSAELDLRRLGTTADAEEIKDTAVAQPLIVALSLLAAEQLLRRLDLPTDAPVAGHSVGELAASAIADVFTPEEAIALAALRGREMAAACRLAATGMSAVLGGDPNEVAAALAQCELDVANHNGAGQIVVAGRIEALAALATHKPARTRVKPLPVAGAFHTRFMAPAERALADYAVKLGAKNPARTLLSNADGQAVSEGAELLDRLVAQVTKPVRWDCCMATLRALGVSATIELPPAGTLSGLVKRELTGTVTLALKAPGDFDKVAGLISDHASGAKRDECSGIHP